MVSKVRRTPDSIRSGQLTVRLDVDVRKLLVEQANAHGMDEAILARMLITDAVTSGAKRDQALMDAMEAGLSKIADLVCTSIASSLPKELLAGESKDGFKERYARSLNDLMTMGDVVRQRIEVARRKGG